MAGSAVEAMDNKLRNVLSAGLLPPFWAVVLLPLTAFASALYAAVMRLRNLAYDRGWKASRSFDLPVICIGNLSVGGTGKTPHVEHVVNLLTSRGLKVAVLSRGYGRATRGFREADPAVSRAEEVGDEPLQISKNCTAATVAVCEDRCHGIEKILSLHPETEVIVLDDAFQHRRVRAGMNVLLTTAQRPFSSDFVMPLGRLREPRSGAVRADAVVVTKCLNEADRNLHIPLKNGVPLFHSSVSYNAFRPLLERIGDSVRTKPIFRGPGSSGGVLLVTGIADPSPLVRFIRECTTGSVRHVAFPDHHVFTASDGDRIRKNFEELKREGEASILVTQKDAQRLLSTDIGIGDLLPHTDVVCIGLEIENEKGKKSFDQTIIDYVDQNKRDRRVD